MLPDLVKVQMEGFGHKIVEFVISVRFNLCAFWRSVNSEILSLVPIMRAYRFMCASACTDV